MASHRQDGEPRLETLSRGTPREDAHPILLVHGAWHGAWCWDLGFMDRLAASGHEVHAVSLRGHGGSEGRERLRGTRIRDYVRDVERAVEAIGRPPLLVGHSMGGFVLMKYLERHAAPAAMLLAPVPHTGVGRLMLRMTRTDPVGLILSNLTLSLLPVVSDADRARRLFFSETMPEPEVATHQASLCEEAYLAYLDMLVLDLPRPALAKAPVSVVAAGGDAIFPVGLVEATAKAFGSSAEVMAGLPHDLMLDAGWEAVADRVSLWAHAADALVACTETRTIAA